MFALIRFWTCAQVGWDADQIGSQTDPASVPRSLLANLVLIQ